MKKALFIGSLISKNDKNDGERIKTSLILESLKKILEVDSVNLTKNRAFHTIVFFFKLLFKQKKYDYLIISKDPHGANIIHKLIKLSRFPSEKTYYFEIGSYLYDGIKEGVFKKDIFIHNKLIVVETNTMKEELNSLGFSNVEVYPNFKPIYDIPFNQQKYPKDTLKLVFFSRVDELKGIYNLIDSVIKINDNCVKYTLDIYGKFQSQKDEDRIELITSKYDFIKYSGIMDIVGPDNYVELSRYDLHVFPSYFYAEGFPGTIIDFFFAGVPTLSSSFINSKDIFKDDDSFIFDIDNNDSLNEKLLYIYNNQSILPSARKNTFNRRNEYSVEEFERYIAKLFI